MAWSHSSLKAFETCARQYHEVRILKKWPRETTPEQLYGTELHKHAEDFVHAKKPVPESFAFLQPMLDTLLAMPGRKLCEVELAVDVHLQPCGFRDSEAWARGIADLLIVDDDNLTARVFDYKTGGNRYPDTDQLDLMALLTFATYPHVRAVTGGLLFVLKGTVTKHRVERSQVPALWARYRERVAKEAAARANGVWNPRQSGLCRKHCPVLTCPHNGRN